MVEVGKERTYINHNGLLLFLKENRANKVRKHANLELHEKTLHRSSKRAQVASGMGKWLGEPNSASVQNKRTMRSSARNRSKDAHKLRFCSYLKHDK